MLRYKLIGSVNPRKTFKILYSILSKRLMYPFLGKQRCLTPQEPQEEPEEEPEESNDSKDSEEAASEQAEEASEQAEAAE